MVTTKAGQLWHNHYDKFIIQQGFECNSRDHCLCSNQKTGVDSARYVDDILSACTGQKALKSFLRLLDKNFRVRHLGEPTKFLGMEIRYYRELGFCTLTQSGYIEQLGHKFYPQQI